MQPLNASAVSILMDSDDQGSIASRTRSRKRVYSQMAGYDESGPNFDIFECFPILLCQYVFQHFDARELLEMSQVNREWNKLVGEKEQVGKLKIVIDRKKHELTRKTKRILTESKRKYENIVADIRSGEKAFLLCVLVRRAGSWKSVHLETAGKQQDFWPEILRFIEPTVEELSITDRNCSDELPSAASSLAFPRLGILKCFTYQRNVFKYFDRVKSLVKFDTILLRDTAEPAISERRTILRNNHKLVRLRAQSNWPVFNHPSDIKLQLKELTFAEYTYDGTDSLQAFMSFLKTQALTLESLKISTQINQALLELVLSMPKLTSLSVFIIDEEISELPVNTTITFLEVEFVTEDEERKLVSALKDLKRFKTNEIDDNKLHFLAQAVPDLESIEVDGFTVRKLPKGSIFPKIKEFKARRICNDLQKPTGDTNFAKLLRQRMSQR